MLEFLKSRDEELGLKLRKSGGGFFSNYASDIYLKFCGALGDYQQEPEIFEKINDGALELDSGFDKQMIDGIREDLKPKIMSDEALVRESGGTEVVRSIDIDPENDIRKLLENKEVREKVHSYFGTDYKLGFAQALYYPAIEDGDEEKLAISTRSWHLDTTAAPNSVRLLVFLTDQTDEGAFEVVNRERTKELLEKHDLYDIEEDPSLIEEKDVKKYSGEKGSAIFSNVVDQIHRGGSSKEEERMILIFSFLPSL